MVVLGAVVVNWWAGCEWWWENNSKLVLGHAAAADILNVCIPQRTSHEEVRDEEWTIAACAQCSASASANERRASRPTAGEWGPGPWHGILEAVLHIFCYFPLCHCLPSKLERGQEPRANVKQENNGPPGPPLQLALCSHCPIAPLPTRHTSLPSKISKVPTTVPA
ncbi:hypothetical protein N431DRAFT_154990 [Stipitochalara longipes BDJ]|nr:hypothetical protein N431DRAFT_154990 [Stipitochalara longipes BDJ]